MSALCFLPSWGPVEAGEPHFIPETQLSTYPLGEGQIGEPSLSVKPGPNIPPTPEIPASIARLDRGRYSPDIELGARGLLASPHEAPPLKARPAPEYEQAEASIYTRELYHNWKGKAHIKGKDMGSGKPAEGDISTTPLPNGTVGMPQLVGIELGDGKPSTASIHAPLIAPQELVANLYAPDMGKGRIGEYKIGTIPLPPC